LMVRMRRNLLQHEEYSILAQSMILLVSVSSVVSSRATRRIKVMQFAFR
jgi:inner membrane protein involved in colicin E2 resistance